MMQSLDDVFHGMPKEWLAKEQIEFIEKLLMQETIVNLEAQWIRKEGTNAQIKLRGIFPYYKFDFVELREYLKQNGINPPTLYLKPEQSALLPYDSLGVLVELLLTQVINA